ncbi:MAG: dienelactone hydrolase family protein [Anaerolineaceae bacterium]|nr:dienelactone hydrolase family protein [Anaerolineaceae bacterium]
MPIYDPSHVEYQITTGHIQIAMDGGGQIPAYWAHPNIGAKLPAVALLHDWWGITPAVRRMANLFAQTGYYAIVPDMFDGQVASNPEEAMVLVEKLGDQGFVRIDTALGVLEKHHHTNGKVAAIGLGMGGSLAFEAAIVRPDLEAAVVFSGFPQRYLGQFKQANTPILAFYGSEEAYIARAVIEQLQQELTQITTMQHHVILCDGLGHDLFAEDGTDSQHEVGRATLRRTFAFLETYLGDHPKPASGSPKH